MTIEWMEIDKLECYLNPDPRKYIVLFNDGEVGNHIYGMTEIMASTNMFGTKITHYAILEIPELPQKKELISFREALQVMLDGGSVLREDWKKRSENLGMGAFFCHPFFRHGHGCYKLTDEDYKKRWEIINKPPKKDIYQDLKEWADERIFMASYIHNDLGRSACRDGFSYALEKIRKKLNE